LWYGRWMNERQGTGEKKAVDAARLLGRGGEALGLAAVAHARGQWAGRGPWFVLTPELSGAAEEILASLEERPSPRLLRTVIKAVMRDKPATAAPGWATPLVDDQSILSGLGASIEIEKLRPALGTLAGDLTAQQKGLAAFAVALCRNLDSLYALAELLPREYREQFTRMGTLAHVLVEPGDPMNMRADLKERLKEA
jgi:hypothetical protein